MIDVNYDDYAYYDRAIEALWFNTIDLLKESLESVGIDLGETNNIIEYKNYLISEPLEFVEYVYMDGAYGPGGIDITGKSVGVVGDSWFDKKPIIDFITSYITEKGGSVVIKGWLASRGGRKPLANNDVPKGEGYTVSAGAHWAGHRLFEPVVNCDIVICELNINNVEAASSNKNWLIGHMKTVKSMLKAQIVICWGMPVVSWKQGMSRTEEKEKATKTNAATSDGCVANGWKYINPRDASHFEDVCKVCQNGTYHIPNDLSKEYFGEMLDLSFMRAGLYSGGSLGMTGSLAMFTDSLDCLNLEAFRPYDAYDKRQKGWIRIKEGVTQRCNAIPNLLNLASEEFKSTALAVGHAEGVPPILFLFIAASEGSLRNSSGARGYSQYSGYFGQSGSGGSGASLETQMKAELPRKYKKLIGLGYSPVEALALSYVVHHLPVMFNLKKFFGKNIWSTNPEDLANILRTTHQKGGSGPMSEVRLAESMLCHLYSPWAASYIARHQDKYAKFL